MCVGTISNKCLKETLWRLIFFKLECEVALILFQYTCYASYYLRLSDIWYCCFSRGGRGGGGRGGGRSGGSFKKDYNGPGASLRKPRWDMNSLPRFEKNFYREHPAVQARSNVHLFVVIFTSSDIDLFFHFFYHFIRCSD